MTDDEAEVPIPVVDSFGLLIIKIGRPRLDSIRVRWPRAGWPVLQQAGGRRGARQARAVRRRGPLRGASADVPTVHDKVLRGQNSWTQADRTLDPAGFSRALVVWQKMLTRLSAW